MNVEKITMEPASATAALAAYYEALDQNRRRRLALSQAEQEEYVAAVKGYEALASGTPIILLSEAINNAPTDDQGRPLLAIARADRKQVKIVSMGGWQDQHTSWLFDCQKALEGWSYLAGRWLGLARTVESRSPLRSMRGYALVPMAPAQIRLEVRKPLRDLWILWEVEEWSDTLIGAKPDLDPLLLSHLGGDAYAVLAAWDLTPLERAVMAGRSEA